MRRIVRLTCVVLVALLAMPMLMATEAGAAPVAPTLESPDAGFVTAVNPPLSWQAVPNATQYNVQISTTNFGATIVDATTYNTNYVPPSELPTGTLYWRVRAKEGSTWGDFSSARDFQKTERGVPVPLDPPNHATLDYPDDPIIVTWQEVYGATSYQVQMDDENTFTSPLLKDTNSDNPGAVVDPALAMGSPVYWRVKAKLPGDKATQWSATWDFTVEWPHIPELVEPPDTFSPAISEVVIEWTPAQGAQSYQLQVSPNVDFTNNTLDVQNLEATRYSPTSTFANGAYFWRVRAKHIWGGFGDWSQTYRFTKAWPAPGDGFPAVSLLTPSNGNFNVSEPNFTWTPQTRAAEYEIWVGDDVNFSPGSYSTCFTDHTRVTPYSECNGIFPVTNIISYWRVRAIDNPKGVLGVWSPTWSFAYNPATPNLNTPADGATVTLPVLTWDTVENIGLYKVSVLDDGFGVVDTATVYNNSWVPDSIDADGSTYYWYVQSVDEDNNLTPIPPSQDWYSFTLNPPAASFAAPNPTSAPGVSGQYPPVISWQPVTNATRYEVWMRQVGAPAFLKYENSAKHAAYAHPDGDLPVGNWQFFIRAFNGGAQIVPDGTIGTFSITDLDITTLVAPTNCASLATCDTVFDTPTLNWQPVDKAEGYIVTIATDPNFTNVLKTYKTGFSQLTPVQSLVDSQANQALYWYARPCYANYQHCGPEPASFVGQPDSPVFAFRKQSAAVELLSPANGATVSDQVTFDWKDFLVTNQSLIEPQTQEAERYRIQVSSQPDFSNPVFTSALWDETTFTAVDEMYPDGPLYWRVQARDNTGNYLTWSETRSLNKVTPAPTLLEPAPNALETGDPNFRWSPQHHAKSYDIEIYKNPDQALSSANRVTAKTVWMPGTFPEDDLPPGVYGWRVRRTDTSNNQLQWSAANNTQLRLFTVLPKAAELVSPANDANVPNNDLLLSWLPVGGAAQYRVQVSTSSSFPNFLSNDVTSTTTWAPTVSVPDNDYYWRVLSLDGSGNTIGTSVTRVFHSPGSTPGVKYTPMPPVRIQDSRPTGPQVGPYGTRWGAGTTRDVQVANANGIPADAEAVTLNVTVTNSTAASFLTLFPAGETRPLASNLNWASGQTIANSVTVKVGTAGKISVYNPTGLVDVIIDAVGYYRSSSGAGFTSLPPTRIQDSRPSGPQVGPYGSPWGPGTDRLITVAGTGGVPADAEAVVVNTTVTNASASSFLTVYPAGASRPLASSLNWFPGMTIANAVTVKVGTGGQIKAYSPTGSVDVIMDVVGYFKTGSGDQFHALSPARIQDSRSGSKVGAYNTPWGAGNDRAVSVTGVGGVPTNAKAVMLNATVTNTSAASFLTIYPAGTTRPLASSLNWSAGWTIPNAVTAKVGSSGQIKAYNPSGTVDVIMDVNGWYG